MAGEKIKIQLLAEAGTLSELTALCAPLGIEHCTESPLALVQTETHLALRKLDEPKLGDVFVDFVAGAMAHRRKFGGGRGEAIAKAVGIKGAELPSVIDATAGLGRDAFVLASIGCQVRLVERHPVVYLLLQDGLNRAYQDAEIGEMMQQNMQLLDIHHITELNPQTESADVVYLDPMYPHKQKSALVKKEMRVFQHLVGADLDADELLTPALQLARKRVVVKRPDYAEFLAQKAPHVSTMLKESVIVMSYDAETGLAKVKCQSQSACGACSAREACGTASLSELNGKRGEHIFTLETITPLRTGQMVEIGLEEKSMLFSVLLMYIVPLFTLLVATLLSNYISENELIRAILIFMLTALSFVMVKRYTRKLDQQTEFQPVLLRVLS